MASEFNPMNPFIPTVDFSPFFHQEREDERKEAVEAIDNACRNWGFFRVVNHGVPPELMARAIELSKIFFHRPYEEKLEAKPVAGPEGFRCAGYAQHENSTDKNEYLLMYSPGSHYNVYPLQPPEFKAILDECFTELSKAAMLVEDILNESMGLPPNFFKEYNEERGFDAMAALRYFPATEHENNGLTAHRDGNYFTLIFQDDVGGLEVLKDEEWIPVEPIKGSITVNIGDILQVLSNNRFKSAMHRVVRRGRCRHSFAFFVNVAHNKWVEPLPQLTAEAGKAPKYKGFFFNEYLQLRKRNKAKPNDVDKISHFAINALSSQSKDMMYI